MSRCGVCGRDVLDLSAFTRQEAAALLSVAEPPCVRFVLREGRPVFREVLRTAAMAAALAGVAEATVRAAFEGPGVLRQAEAAATSLQSALPVTGGKIAPGHKWR